ncbi:chemotaxis protein MotB [Oleomonas cavernae]|uniref:Chemotaxis protein MotB n=1 Tax=Oleomonas cavernae TaxID=2320859 RepID=A0A418WBD3_9PROT|nr:flagellar motor protein MotB [Oleomonas cavernae]RJF87284.1 chemotaxis protein MotB [Oleomonas cavernae]
MAGQNDLRPIIIKRVKKVEGGHHGGAWKVAYADFVTAMMAFFLLLWLLNATSEAQKQGIADYFDPVSVSETTSGAGGVLGGQTITQDSNRNDGGSPTGLVTQIEPDSETTDQEETDQPLPLSGLAQNGPADSTQSANGGLMSSAIAAPIPGAASAAPPSPQSAETIAQTNAQARAEQQRFSATAESLRQALQASPELREAAKQVLIDITPEGMRIQLVDAEGKPMFQTGSSRMSDEMVALLGKIAGVITRLPNRIAIAGHTDAAPYRTTNGYSNWELSADRANSSRRVLTESGVRPARIYQISGKAASEPLIPDNPLDPANRRITITLLRESPVLPPGIAMVPAVP